MRLIICLTYILYKVNMYIFLKENTINKVYLKKFSRGIIDRKTEGVVPQPSHWFFVAALFMRAFHVVF